MAIAGQCGGIEPLFDVLFSFLYRRTDFFHVMEPGDKIGFKAGKAKEKEAKGKPQLRLLTSRLAATGFRHVRAVPYGAGLAQTSEAPREGEPVEFVAQFWWGGRDKPKSLGPFASVRDLLRRARCWYKVVLEHGQLCAVYEKHRADGWFAYGAPPENFAALSGHEAVKTLLALRGPHPMKSTLHFEGDFAVLPTYLPIEEGAAGALGAVSLAAAELFEARTGRAQHLFPFDLT